MATIPTELFAMLLSLVENPNHDRARALIRRFECTSVSELLLRLVKADEAAGAELQREILDTLATVSSTE